MDPCDVTPEDVRTITVTNPATGETFDVQLSAEMAVELAAFCVATRQSPQQVLEQAIARVLDGAPGYGFGV